MFQPGDLVLRKVFENMADPTVGKFQPNWEGPHLVTRAGESGDYALDKLMEPLYLECGTLHILRGIINKE